MAAYGAGSGEHDDKQIWRCHAPSIGFAAARRGREFPPNVLQLGKRARGMFGQRVVGEGMGKGNGESITANAMTSITKTNQCPAFDSLHKKISRPLS